MYCPDHRGLALSTEHVLRQFFRQLFIELLHIAHPAAQHDHVRVKHVDYGRQAAGQVLKVMRHGLGCVGVTIARVASDIKVSAVKSTHLP